MNKRLFSAMILCSVILLHGAVPAFAESATSSTPNDFSGTDSGVIYVGDPSNSNSAVYPVNITMQTIGGIPYITKIYEVAADYAVEQLVDEFEQDGYAFCRSDVLVKQLEGTTETKTASKTVTAAAHTDEKDKLLSTVEQTLDYSQDGYTGQLKLDASAISFAETDRTSYGYTLRETREYDGLDRNDAAYIDKTMQKNGVTLELESVDWQVMGTTPVDGTLVPNLYKATATYSGRATASKASGYTASLVYSGEVTKTSPGQQQVSVIYRGSPIASGAADRDRSDIATALGMCALSFVFASCGAALVVFLSYRHKKKIQQELLYPEDDDSPVEEQELLGHGYDPMAYDEEDDDEIY